MSFLRLAVRNVARPRVAFATPVALATRGRILQSASYSAAAGLSKEQITARVLDVLKGFEKVKQDKVSRMSVTFYNGHSRFYYTSSPLLLHLRETSAWIALTPLKLLWQ